MDTSSYRQKLLQRLALFLVAFFKFVPAAFANQPVTPELNFPLIDLPYNNSDGYTAPSMQQSLEFSKDYYQYFHHLIEQQSSPAKYKVYIAVFDFLSTWGPFGNSWLHEEWHRTVMGQYGISSYNEIYDLPLFAETVAVSHVADEDLIWLKANHPADQVRLSAAGIEAQSEQNLLFEKDHFFRNTRSWDTLLLWLNTMNSIFYLHTCATDESNAITSELLSQEGTNIDDRDFTGLDCNAWVYDLFRPDEPYGDRGTHPSGVGIDRYISYDDLTDDEKDYLKKNYYLSLINLADPFLFFHERFVSINPFNQQPYEWNLNFRHHLTSFGNSIEANLFYQQKQDELFIRLQRFSNYQRHFVGIDSEWRNLKPWAGSNATLTTRLAIWQQPLEQQFQTSTSFTGGLVGARINMPINSQKTLYLGLSVKSDGWVAGNVSLFNTTDLVLGFTVRQF